MRRVILSKSEEAKLANLHKNSPNSVERQRSHCLLLSQQKISMAAIAKILGITVQTVASLFNAWESAPADNRFSVLRYAEGQGAKRKLEPVKELLPEILEANNRNINLTVNELDREHSIKVCKVTLRNFLKDTGLYVQTSSEVLKKQAK
jgi:transposase